MKEKNSLLVDFGDTEIHVSYYIEDNEICIDSINDIAYIYYKQDILDFCKKEVKEYLGV